MSLNIGGSTVGYDVNGMLNLIDAINLQIIPDVCVTLRNKTQEVRSTIDTVWVGSSAEAFKEKLSSDNELMCNCLMALSDEIKASMNNAGSNVEEVDNEVAKMFGGGTDDFVSTYERSQNIENTLKKGIEVGVGAAVSSFNPILGAGIVGDALTNGTTTKYAIAGVGGVVEGVGTVVEGLIDGTSVIVTTATVLPIKYTVGLASNAVLGEDNFINNAIDSYLNLEMSAVKKNIVGDTADSIYKITGADQVKKFQNINNVSKGIGEIAASVGGGLLVAPITAAAGLGAAAGATASAAASTTTFASSGTLVSAFIAGVSKTGETSSDVWNSDSNASFEKGIAVGAARGTLEFSKMAAMYAVPSGVGKVNSIVESGLGNSEIIGTICTKGEIAEEFVAQTALNVGTDWGDAALKQTYNDNLYKNYYEYGDNWADKTYKTYVLEHGSVTRGIVESTVQGIANSGISKFSNYIYTKGYEKINGNTKEYDQIKHSMSEQALRKYYDKSVSDTAGYYISDPMEDVCKSISGEDTHIQLRMGDDTSDTRFINTSRISS